MRLFSYFFDSGLHPLHAQLLFSSYVSHMTTISLQALGFCFPKAPPVCARCWEGSAHILTLPWLGFFVAMLYDISELMALSDGHGHGDMNSKVLDFTVSFLIPLASSRTFVFGRHYFPCLHFLTCVSDQSKTLHKSFFCYACFVSFAQVFCELCLTTLNSLPCLLAR